MADTIFNPYFMSAFQQLIRDEGGFVNDPDDPGGKTKYGISQRRYPDLSIENLTLEDAARLYHRDWWQRYGYARIEHAGLAAKVFNLAVNMGGRQAHRLAQRALRAAGYAVTEDGVLGAESFAAMNAADPGSVLAALRSEAAGFYRGLVAQRPAFKKFLQGWLRRAYH